MAEVDVAGSPEGRQPETERVATALASESVRFADAPLTRSPKDAEAGKLTALVGADAATLAVILPVLETFSENVFHSGPVGSGNKLKLINNFLSQGVAALVAEAVTTATKAGVDLQMLFDVVSAGGANSAVFQRFMPWVLGEESGMVFRLKNGQKDVRYYTHLAEAVGSTAFLGEAVLLGLCGGRDPDGAISAMSRPSGTTSKPGPIPVSAS